MEKRWSERIALRVGVDVYQHGRQLGSCASRNIGLGGTFLSLVENDVDKLVIQKAQNVELVFSLLSQGHEIKHTLHAQVARVNTEGVGFKFCDFDTGVFRSLQALLVHQSGAWVNQG
jgi:PilZ domain